MKLLVPVKRVPDPYAKLLPLPDGSGLDTGGVKWDLNPFDEIALEAAVRLRESGLDAEIVVVSIGPAETEDQLRKALAMGADRAILLETNEAPDSAEVARLLTNLAEELQPDLILMGKQATDTDNNQTGQRLAQRLAWPQATFAAKLEPEPGSIKVTRETDSGEAVVEVPLPAVVTVDLRLAEPRYIALPGIIKARSKPLEKRQVEVKPSQLRLVKLEPAPKRPPGRKVSGVDDLIAALKAAGALS
jgi:electron transfer flavoprotein beta subunit